MTQRIPCNNHFKKLLAMFLAVIGMCLLTDYCQGGEKSYPIRDYSRWECDDCGALNPDSTDCCQNCGLDRFADYETNRYDKDGYDEWCKRNRR